ncbi:MAG: STAS domain-containing protein [Synechocystis sp.]|jgi:anti-anti-sigma regulatory factor
MLPGAATSGMWVLMPWIEKTPAQDLILDLQPLRQVNNQLLMSLVHAYKTAQALGKTLRLASVSVELRMVLELSRLDQVLDYVST